MNFSQDSAIEALSKNSHSRFDEYTEAKSNKGIRYLPTGHKHLDDAFHGWERGKVYGIAARPGLGKTFLACEHMVQIDRILPYTNAKGEVIDGDILVFSLELTFDQIIRRFDSMLSKVSYHRLSKATLTKAEERTYSRYLRISAKKSRILVADKVFSLAEMKAIALARKPSIILIDGLYQAKAIRKVRGNSTHEHILAISRDLKIMAKEIDVPIVYTTQMNREGEGSKKFDSSFDAQKAVAFSDALVQDADVLLVGYQTPEMKVRNSFGLQSAKTRDGDELSCEYELDLVDMKFGYKEGEDSADPSGSAIPHVTF
ncbi:DnaB-like helicase C-terminal domain-containing protein [Flammeovirga agarivorans]|uniref:AAA family ATPase n=1 Tax=Flammeovirga agarivorans TaxID=2726742 RepID=A0A7X8SRA7_9BACT|nr:DnaB-like helicase C-terminal domain-containing protein [Flammeovirga agarivorans]NLR94933.1 AAA family ATPase [Flammeovirga agarivorans]